MTWSRIESQSCNVIAITKSLQENEMSWNGERNPLIHLLSRGEMSCRRQNPNPNNSMTPSNNKWMALEVI